MHSKISTLLKLVNELLQHKLFKFTHANLNTLVQSTVHFDFFIILFELINAILTLFFVTHVG